MFVVDHAVYEKNRFKKTFLPNSNVDLILIPQGYRVIIKAIDFENNIYFETEGIDTHRFTTLNYQIHIPDLMSKDCVFTSMLFCKTGFMISIYATAYTDLTAHFLDAKCMSNPRENNPIVGDICQIIFKTTRRRCSFILPTNPCCAVLQKVVE